MEFLYFCFFNKEHALRCIAAPNKELTNLLTFITIRHGENQDITDDGIDGVDVADHRLQASVTCRAHREIWP